jgi:hypothetical protein
VYFATSDGKKGSQTTVETIARIPPTIRVRDRLAQLLWHTAITLSVFADQGVSRCDLANSGSQEAQRFSRGQNDRSSVTEPTSMNNLPKWTMK